MRAVVRDGLVLTKTLKMVPNRQVQQMFSHLQGLDGELTVGPAYRTHPEDDVYERSRGILMTKRPTAEADIRFHVFDRWDRPQLPASARIELIGDIKATGVVLVGHAICDHQEHIDIVEKHYLLQGFEGAMLRRADAPYKYGQATEKEGYLLKLKRFNDSECVILDTIEQMANDNVPIEDELGRMKRSAHKAGKRPKGTLGAFVVRDIFGLFQDNTFEVASGPGLTDELRQRFWDQRDQLVGQVFTYTYQGYGSQERPRIPQFKAFRPSMDLLP